MISDPSNFRVQIWRLFVIMIRTSYRWICSHPFLLGFVGFLYCLHITCPLLFSLLVASSPVLVCTFVLLGTILSFGELNIPEIGKESETVHEATPFTTNVSRDASIVERGENSFTVERFVSTAEKDVLDDVDRLGENQLSEVEDDGRSFDYRPLVDETLDEIKPDTHVRFEEKVFVLELDKKEDRVEEKSSENGGKQVLDAEQSMKNSGSLDEMMDDSKEDQMDVSPVSPWRPMRHEEDEDDDADHDDSLDSESDGAESSSPDASMTDIIPMLDELHPLLHSEAPSRGIADGGESDAASEGPHRSSSDEGMESDVDSESHGEEGDNENEVEDEDEQEEEEKKQDKEDESKSAIKWTEADQKNVMDLGSLELERNQRLENLIARRRARHNMRLMSERNLIDFDSADIPFNMQPISTARQNPFDFTYDSYDDMPIPGSAPSIMFARRNPFDLPYEPNEEKPNLKGDGFEEEFSSQQPKDPVFRRHESFSVGPSMLGGPRHDRLRPFFVLERLAHEGTSYYPFERQLSEVSESKVSSVPDTESVCTILEDDEKKVDEHNADRETEIKVDIAAENDEEKSHMASDNDEEKSQPASDHDEEKCLSASEHEGSDFDEQADSRNLHHDVAEIILGSAETQHEKSKMMEGETSDMRKHDEEDSSDSDSSLSEKVEEIPDISENESMLILEQKVDLHEESDTSQPSFGGLEIHVASGMDDDYHHNEAPAEDSFIAAYPSLEESAINDLCGLVDNHHEEPVYDSSPASASRFPSFSSVSSDSKPDLPGKNGEEVQENVEKKPNVYSESIGPTEIHSDGTEASTREVGDTSTHVPGESPDVVHDIAETSANRSVAEEIMHEEEEECKQKDEASPQTFNADVPIDNSTLSSGAVEYVETHSFNDEYVPQLEQDPVHSSVSDAKEETHPNQTMDIQVDSVNASAQNVGSEEMAPSESDRELTWSDKSVVEQSSVEAGEDQVPTRVVFSRNITFHEYHDAPEDAGELSCLTSDTSSTPAESPEYKTPMVGESSRAEFFQEAVYDNVVEQLDRLTDLHAISQRPPEVITEEADDVKEIDEGLLSELDTIGDFSVKEVVTDSEHGLSSIGSDTTDKLTEALPVLEARSVEDIESAFQQIHEGSEVDDVILPSTVQDQLAQENYGNSTETKSDLAVVEATSKENLVNSMNQAVVESMGKQPQSPESDGGSTEIKCAVETEPSESSVVERSLDEANVPLNNTPKKDEEEEEEKSRPKDITTADVSSIKTRSLEEIPRPSEPKEGMAEEVNYERVVNPTEGIESGDVTLSDDVVAEEAKAETASNADANVQTSDSKETPENLGNSIAEQK